MTNICVLNSIFQLNIENVINCGLFVYAVTKYIFLRTKSHLQQFQCFVFTNKQTTTVLTAYSLLTSSGLLQLVSLKINK